MEERSKEKFGSNNILLVLLGLVVLLLAFIAIQQLPTKKSTECQQAIKMAQISVDTDLDFMYEYDDAIYGPGVANINQQLFRVNEFEYYALEKIMLLQRSLLRIIVECED